MIDCSKTKNYFVEKKRMIKKDKYTCEIDCCDCPLGRLNSGINVSCSSLEANYPEKAIEIVQKWSNEHPQKTLLTEFLKYYPNAELKNGLPPICVETLGLVNKDCIHEFNECYMDCRECWNTPIKERKDCEK